MTTRVEAALPHALLFLVLFLSYVTLLHIAKRSKSKQQQQQGHGRLLPSPPGLPLIGHLHLAILYRLQGILPNVSFCDLTAKYGRDGLVLIRLGSMPMLAVSSRRAAEAVMRTQDHLLAWRPPSTMAHTLFYGSRDVIFASYSDHWRQAKKLLTTHLLTMKKVQSYRTVREEEVRRAMAKVSDAAMASKALDVSELLYGFTFDVMCRAAVSGRVVKADDDMSRLFRELINLTEKLIGGLNLEDYFPWLLRVGVFRRAVCAKADRLRKRWDELLDKVIDDHERNQAQQHEHDFVDVLLSHQHEYGLTKDHLKALLIDIFVAGTDTSYLVLEYAMVELVRNPHVTSRLQDEVRHRVLNTQEMVVTEEVASSMAYLKAFIKETLRLHPPAPMLAPHYSLTEVDIDGYVVPAKTPILINNWALARDSSVWKDAEEFKPERFMEMGSEASINFKGNDFQFLPFGAGRRMCPGINFSISSIEVLLANLVYHFNWEVPTVMGKTSIDMTEEVCMTLHRKEKLFLVPKMVGV
ncbi:hypothetical protein PR202_gb06914 [Eleusine coracana subsp. coracana]|uniref:Uncharacterized protein n=1 Tax=Eleusine coracana subsp. coracana TaxID=191504 RepID=A0AAV5E8D7_ELECO|nr:hypothetical protein PR202_gb06914 [Eleusine coracana subsp. coracana]